PVMAVNIPSNGTFTAKLNSDGPHYVGDLIYYTIVLTGEVNQPRIQFPSFDKVNGIKVLEGPQTQTYYSVINGVSSIERSWMFKIEVRSKGEITIPGAT